MANRWRVGGAVAMGILCITAIVRAGPPASQPTSDVPSRRSSPGAMIARLEQSLAELDLSAEQKQKIHALLDHTRSQVQEARDGASNGDRRAAVDKIRTTLADSRTQLQTILTPDQQDKLRELMQQEPDRPIAGNQPKPSARTMENDDSKTTDNKMSDSQMTDSKTSGGDTMMSDKPEKSSAPSTTAKPQTAIASIAVGQPAPEFARRTLEGKLIQPSAFKGRVMVLVFGSYSTPTFRDRAASLQKLAAQYGTKADLYVVYTREAHAAGEWDVQRNKEDKISLEQPKTEADRIHQAEESARLLKISVPVIVDGMDDAIANAYGLSPNGAVIIGRDGNVFARQRWFESIGLAEQLDAAIAARNAQP